MSTDRSTELIRSDPGELSDRLADSARCRHGAGPGLAGYYEALLAEVDRMSARAVPKPLNRLRDWAVQSDGSSIRHHSGRFFAVEGLQILLEGADETRMWDQPTIVQPEVGLLGIIAREIDGVLHFLMQNKAEPGNLNGIQVSPTVQATRSNFGRVHGGLTTSYLDYFRGKPPVQVRTLTDVRQSEHGSWFLRKRNRNVVIEVLQDIEVLEGFHWLTLGELSELMQVDDLVNMETRSVLSCLPYHAPYTRDGSYESSSETALWRSLRHDQGSLIATSELTSWITRVRTDHHVTVQRRPLGELEGWTLSDEHIARDDGLFFKVIGVEVTAEGREVRRWDQPMVSTGTSGVVAFVVRTVEGVLHVLIQLRAEGGNLDGPEIAPTVQCDPANYVGPGATPPPLLDRVVNAPTERILYDTKLSDEGGRFFQISHRHLIVEDAVEAPPGFCWVTLHQLGQLAQHSNYLNVQSRSLMACLQSLLAGVSRVSES